MLKLILWYFGHLMWRANSLEKTLMLGKTEGRRRWRQRIRQLDGITDSVNTWVKVAHVLLFVNPTDYTVHGILQARILEWVVFPFSRDLPNSGIEPRLPHCGQILYQLSHQGSPRILEWVAYPFSSRSSQPRNPYGVFCIVGGFFTSWATREHEFEHIGR